MNEAQARDEICRVGRSLFERGYVHSTAGNISARLPPAAGGGFLITPTDSCLGFLEPGELAHVDDQGVQRSGARASKTLALHRRIYAAAERVGVASGCVLHTHSTHCVALTLGTMPDYMPGPCDGPELLPPLTPYYVMKVGRVPVIEYGVPGATVVADRVVATIERYAAKGIGLRAVMLERLGPMVWHTSPAAAMATLEELEETARLGRTVTTGRRVLDEHEIQALRDTFGVSW